MGVRGLWNILASVQEYRPLAELGGETVAIDLSIWVCGDMSINHHLSVAVKLYLRNLFFRTLNLLRQNTLPVLVVDGVAPRLKANTISHRLGTKDGKPPASLNPATIVQRRRFAAISGECCSLLNALGVPWVQSPGEAEAMCAFLDAQKLVHGCITNDGDAFLYGATTVYRHFTMDSRDASVRVYRSSRIQNELKLTQYRLALLGILLGCDYWPAGVKGLGGAGITTLLASIRSMTDAELKELVLWLRSHNPSTENELKQAAPFHFLDAKVTRLWLKIGRTLSECPVEQIMDEFLASLDKRAWTLPPATKISSWRRPDLRAIVAFCTSRLDWNPDYTLHHLLPLVALWDLRHPHLSPSPKHSECHTEYDDAVALVPIRIVKKRTVNFVPCYEVEWKRLDFDRWTLKAGLSTRIIDPAVTSADGSNDLVDSYRFPVPVADFRSCHPILCSNFESELAKPKSRAVQQPSRNAKPKTTTDHVKRTDLVTLMDELSVHDRDSNDHGARRGHNSKSSQRVLCWDSNSESESDWSPKPNSRTHTVQVSALRETEVTNTVTESEVSTENPPISHAFRLDATVSRSMDSPLNNFCLQSSLLTPSPKNTVTTYVHSPTPSSLSNSDATEFDVVKTPASLRERLAKMF